MGRPLDHNLEQVLEAVEKGITRTGTAKVLGCSLDTVVRYAKRWQSVDDALKSKRRELVDLAEMGLRGAVLAREPWALAFALRTLGKEEGYTERTEHTGPNGGPITMTWNLTKLDDEELLRLERAARKAALEPAEPG